MYRVLVGKPEGKRPLGRLRRRWEDNIKANSGSVMGGGVWTVFDYLYEPYVLYIGRAHRYPPNTPFYTILNKYTYRIF
jgi:hypothetical protein